MLNSKITAVVFAVNVALAPLAAQAQTAVGAGLGAAEANSASVSGAVSGAVNNNVFTSPANTSSRVSGTTTVRTVPTAIAPGLAAAGIETCLGSVSVGGSFVGGGFSFGSTVKDDDCNRRLYARQLYNMGFKNAAAVLQCITPEVNYAMAVAGTPCPNPPNMQPVSAPLAPTYRAQPGNTPPPGYAVSPAYLEWQREETNRQGRRGRRSAALEAQQQPGPNMRDSYASARVTPGLYDWSSR